MNTVPISSPILEQFFQLPKSVLISRWPVSSPFGLKVIFGFRFVPFITHAPTNSLFLMKDKSWIVLPQKSTLRNWQLRMVFGWIGSILISMPLSSTISPVSLQYWRKLVSEAIPMVNVMLSLKFLISVSKLYCNNESGMISPVVSSMYSLELKMTRDLSGDETPSFLFKSHENIEHVPRIHN